MQDHCRAGRKRIEMLVAAASSRSQPPSASKAKANVEAATKPGNDAEGTKDEGAPLPAAAPMLTSCGGSGRGRAGRAAEARTRLSLSRGGSTAPGIGRSQQSVLGEGSGRTTTSTGTGTRTGPGAGGNAGAGTGAPSGWVAMAVAGLGHGHGRRGGGYTTAQRFAPSPLEDGEDLVACDSAAARRYDVGATNAVAIGENDTESKLSPTNAMQLDAESSMRYRLQKRSVGLHATGQDPLKEVLARSGKRRIVDSGHGMGVSIPEQAQWTAADDLDENEEVVVHGGRWQAAKRLSQPRPLAMLPDCLRSRYSDAPLLAPQGSKPVGRTKERKGGRERFSGDEERYLREGVGRYNGAPNMWKAILSAYPFNSKRTAVDLKDKWRNIRKNLGAA